MEIVPKTRSQRVLDFVPDRVVHNLRYLAEIALYNVNRRADIKNSHTIFILIIRPDSSASLQLISTRDMLIQNIGASPISIVRISFP